MRFIFILATFLAIIQNSFADTLQPKLFPFSTDMVEARNLFTQKERTNFSAFSAVKRTTNSNVYMKVLPTVVKVITKRGHGSGVVDMKVRNQQDVNLVGVHFVEKGQRLLTPVPWMATAVKHDGLALEF